MRILCTTQPAHGHARPLLPVAATLAARGHDVRFGTSARFGSVVAGEGYRAEAVGLDWLEADKSTIPPELKAPASATTLAAFFAHQFIRMTAERLARGVVALGTDWRPDLIVRETTEFGGLLAAEALGIPSVAVQVGSPSLLDASVVAEARIALDEARRRMGLPIDPGGEALDGELVVSFAPPGLHDPTVTWPRRFQSFRPADPGPDDDTALEIGGLGIDRPLVYATLGTVFNSTFYDLPFFPAVLEGVRDVPVDVLISVGPGADPAALGPQPPTVRVASFVPQRAVLARSSLAICHGGFGTLLDCIDAAVPLVVVPFGADQYLNADSVERLGIGRAVDDEDLTPARIRAAATEVLYDDGYRQRIGDLRQAWHGLPGPDAAALAIEEAAGHH